MSTLLVEEERWAAWKNPTGNSSRPCVLLPPTHGRGFLCSPSLCTLPLSSNWDTSFRDQIKKICVTTGQKIRAQSNLDIEHFTTCLHHLMPRLMLRLRNDYKRRDSSLQETTSDSCPIISPDTGLPFPLPTPDPRRHSAHSHSLSPSPFPYLLPKYTWVLWLTGKIVIITANIDWTLLQLDISWNKISHVIWDFVHNI